MATMLASASSIDDNLNNDEKLLKELGENEDLFLQCYSIGDGLLQSDKATSCSARSSCSTRSSIIASDGAASPFPSFMYASSVEFSDDEEKVKEPDSDDEDNISPEHFPIIRENTKPAFIVKENICLTEEQKVEKNSFSQFFCRPTTCLEYLGILFFFVCVFLGFGSWSLKQITQTESWKHVEGSIPIYLSCLMMFACGVFAFTSKFFQKRRQYKKLIWFVLFLSLVCAAFCIFSLIYLITVIHSSLNQLHACVFNDVDHICSCYAPNKKVIKFAENMGCSAVKDKLKELAYAVSVLFGVGCLISIATAVSAFFLLCRERRERKSKMVSRQESLHVDEAIQNTNASMNDDIDEESTFSTIHHHSNHQQQRVVLTQPSRDIKNKRKDKRRKENIKDTKISSVATQTPSFMMPIYDVIDPNEHGLSCDEDTFSETSLDLMKNPLPPSYNEAVQNLKRMKK